MNSGRRSRLLIEGWRFLPHSYALVAQAHCLCLARRADVDLRFADLPFYDPAWKSARGILSAQEEAILAALPSPEPAFSPDATFTLRAERPDFGAPRAGRKFAFGTAEYRVLTPANVAPLRCAAEVDECVHVVTPSRWAGLAYERFGFPSARVHVVPHGVDPATFHPDEAARQATRRALGIGEDFLYVCAGAMTWNKGLDILLGAFAQVAETDPHVRLLLKGADALYPSRELVNEVLDDLPARARATVASRLVYEGRTFSGRVMAELLRAGDCYVSPYRAEGFNLPVLEAMACGVPVLCTAGGPTDEFTAAAFASRIDARPLRRQLGEVQGDVLEPDLAHLVALMRESARDREGLRARGALAAAHARERYSWEIVTDALLARLRG